MLLQLHQRPFEGSPPRVEGTDSQRLMLQARIESKAQHCPAVVSYFPRKKPRIG